MAENVFTITEDGKVFINGVEISHLKAFTLSPGHSAKRTCEITVAFETKLEIKAVTQAEKL